MKFDHKLRHTTALKKLPEPLRANLQALYAPEHDLKTNLLACLINGLYTEGISRFLFSVRELEALVRADNKVGNIKRKSLNDREFSTFKKFLIVKQVIDVETEATRFVQGHKGGHAAFCKLIDPRIVHLIKSGRKARTPDRVIKAGQSIKESDDISPEQQAYENGLTILPIDPELMKLIKDKTRRRLGVSRSQSTTEDEELEEIMNTLRRDLKNE